MSHTQVPFVLCDVFTEQQFQGNQLAVVTDAKSLSSEDMQNIAREFNFSECTFVLEGNDDASHVVRIFTPTHEVPFAGHPNVGTAHVLAAETLEADLPAHFCFQEAAGLVEVSVTRKEEGILCEIKAPESLSTGGQVRSDEIANALTLDLQCIDTSVHLPTIASVGLPFILAGVTSRESLSRANIDMAGFRCIFDNYPCADILLYWKSANGLIHSRVFAPFDNVPEDPATGSANAALVALLASIDKSRPNTTSYTVHQGEDMGRPSRIFLRTENNRQGGNNVFIAGYSRIIGKGHLLIDGPYRC